MGNWGIDWDNDRVGSKQQMYPNGRYRMLITNWKAQTVKKDNDEQMKILVEMEIQNKGDYCKAPFTLWCGEKDKWKLPAVVEACNVEVSGKMEVNTPAFNRVLDQCKGKYLLLDLEENPQYNSNNIKSFMPDLMTGEEKSIDLDEEQPTDQPPW